MIDREDELRALFASARSDPRLSVPDLDLLEVYGRDNARFRLERLSAEEARIPRLLTHWWRPVSEAEEGRPSVVSADEFERRFRAFTCGIFDGMDWSNLFLAGGAVLACVLPEAEGSGGFAGSDLDLFVYGLDSEEAANARVRHVHETIRRNAQSRGHLVRTNRAVTILGEHPVRHVQIILRLYASPTEVLLGFDIDACCIGFDGRRVLCLERCALALARRRVVVNPARRSLTYEPRLLKYARRGFALQVPGLRKPDIDPQLFRPPMPDPQRLQGLRKLLLYEYQQRVPPAAPAPAPGTRGARVVDGVPSPLVQEYQRGQATQEGASEYAAAEVYLPWGPAWYAESILRMLNFTDRALFFRHRQRGGRTGRVRAGAGGCHRHIFVTSIEGIFEGDPSAFWCRLCKRRRALAGDDGTGRFVPAQARRLQWVRDCPAFQDLELQRADGPGAAGPREFRRRLPHPQRPFALPELELDWELGVYRADRRRQADLVFRPAPLHLLDALLHPPSPALLRALPTPPAAAPSSSSEAVLGLGSEAGGGGGGSREGWRCGRCGVGFASRNLLWRHCLAALHFSRPPPPPPPPRSAAADPPPSPPSPPRPALPPLDRGGDPSVIPAASSSRPLLHARAVIPPPPPPGSEANPMAPPSTTIPRRRSPPQSPSRQASPPRASVSVASVAPPVPAPAGTPAADPSAHDPPRRAQTATQTRGRRGAGQEVEGGGCGRMAQAVLQIGALWRAGMLSGEERGKLKELVLRGDERLFAILEAFRLDPDTDDLLDSLCRLILLASPSASH